MLAPAMILLARTPPQGQASTSSNTLSLDVSNEVLYKIVGTAVVACCWAVPPCWHPLPTTATYLDGADVDRRPAGGRGAFECPTRLSCTSLGALGRCIVC